MSKRARNFVRKPFGFSLVEVIASLMILEVITLSILGMYSFASRTFTLNQQRLQVNNLLQWKMEEIQCKPFAVDVTEAGGTFSGHPTYLFDVTQIVPYNGNAYLKRVDVALNYISPAGVTQQENLVALIADY